ncbi:MAG TPA: hypothetical protein VF476_03555, partial [Chitinophagaceae bacterium]
MTGKENLQELVSKALSQTATEDELQKLTQLIEEDQLGEVTGYIESQLQNSMSGQSILPASEKEEAIINKVLAADKIAAKTPARIFSFSRKMAAAAALFIFISLAAILWTRDSKREET